MYTILFKDLNAKDILNDYFLFGEQTSIKMLPNTNKINVILGSNNSGKSRFIRRLMNSTNIIGLNEFIINEYNEIIEEVNLLISRRSNQNHYLLKKINASDSIESDLAFNNERFQNFKYLLTHLEIKYSEITNKLIFSFSDKKKYFIPTLRTAHSLFNLEKSSVDKSIYDNTGNDFKKIEDDIYLHTYIKNYSLNKNCKSSAKSGLI